MSPSANEKQVKEREASKKRRTKEILITISISCGVFLGLLFVMNAAYFYHHFRFFFSSNSASSSTSAFLSGSASGTRLMVATSTPNYLEIPSLGIQAPIIYIEQRNERVYQEALKHGVVHFPGTALPGEAGNVYIFGHSSDYLWSAGEYKTVFALLTNIQIGDVITVTNARGKIFTYRVTETKVVGPKDLSVLRLDEKQKSLLTLQTSYPLGTALRRFIVVSELESK